MNETFLFLLQAHTRSVSNLIQQMELTNSFIKSDAIAFDISSAKHIHKCLESMVAFAKDIEKEKATA